jgi:hypothetical protein
MLDAVVDTPHTKAGEHGAPRPQRCPCSVARPERGLLLATLSSTFSTTHLHWLPPTSSFEGLLVPPTPACMRMSNGSAALTARKGDLTPCFSKRACSSLSESCAMLGLRQLWACCTSSSMERLEIWGRAALEGSKNMQNTGCGVACTFLHAERLHSC